jgi:hypothetical protein
MGCAYKCLPLYGRHKWLIPTGVVNKRIPISSEMEGFYRSYFWGDSHLMYGLIGEATLPRCMT